MKLLIGIHTMSMKYMKKIRWKMKEIQEILREYG